LCINSDTLKRRIQGVNELKDVVRTYRVYLSSRIPKLVEWLNNNSIFEKVYIINTHYELLKRSGEYFRFLVLEDALSNEHLALMFQTAQRCDHDSKLAYYKIFQEVSRHMKKEQINFIIDQILETEGASVSCEDINLLYDLEKESNYFPL
jgi:ubiquitin carboxyl-terminal hydrolase 34